MLHPSKQEPTKYADIKAFRSRYGFGALFAPYVYPGDPNLQAPDVPDPNAAIKARLDASQAQAYVKALYGWTAAEAAAHKGKLSEGCIGDAFRAVEPEARQRAEARLKAANTDDAPCDAECQATKAGENRVNPMEAAYTACLKRLGVPMARIC